MLTASGITTGKRIAIVPHEEPVANATAAATTMTSAGSDQRGRASLSTPVR